MIVSKYSTPMPAKLPRDRDGTYRHSGSGVAPTAIARLLPRSYSCPAAAAVRGERRGSWNRDGEWYTLLNTTDLSWITLENS